MFQVWAGRSRLLRTGGLRSRPHPGPGAFASGRAASGAVATVRLIDRRQHPPAFGRAAPRPAPFARPRPSKACSPLRSSASCVQPSAPRPEGSLRLRSRYALAPLRLPAAPAGSSKLSPASAATARRSTSFQLPPARRASLVWPACSVGPPASQPCNPTRATHGQLPPSGTNSTARHTDAGRIREKNYQGAAAAPPPLWGIIISGISSWGDR